MGKTSLMSDFFRGFHQVIYHYSLQRYLLVVLPGLSLTMAGDTQLNIFSSLQKPESWDQVTIVLVNQRPLIAWWVIVASHTQTSKDYKIIHRRKIIYKRIFQLLKNGQTHQVDTFW